jgi:hypothetical protein
MNFQIILNYEKNILLLIGKIKVGLNGIGLNQTAIINCDNKKAPSKNFEGAFY